MDTSSRPFLQRLLGIAGALLLVAGCATTPEASLSSSAPASPAPVPTASGTLVASASVAPTPEPTPRPTPAPTPTATSASGDLAVVADAPEGRWTSLHWIRLGALPLGPTQVTVSGWKGGYVAFDRSGGDDGEGNVTPLVIRASGSRDGAHWSAPTMLDTAGLDEFVAVERIVQGPAGLLALGYPFGDTCGGPEPVVAVWSSQDGTTWERLRLPKPFRTGQALSISGSEPGYLAIGNTGDLAKPAIWTSSDGRSWFSRTLPTVTSGELVLDGGTAFAGGFVLVGSVLGEGECGGPAHLHPATWWSTDGAVWARSDLPGASTDAQASLEIRTLTDLALVAIQALPDGSARGWTSKDGRTWSSVAKLSNRVRVAGPTDGRHEVAAIAPESGAARVFAINDDASVTRLATSGDGPVQSEYAPAWMAAVGPTGVLAVTEDGNKSWLGLHS
ncbi:MAG TPA: hypothetical protein VGK63_01030 [Candidatus Limnocylindrales bacterium]